MRPECRAARPSDMSDHDQRVADAAVDGLTAYYAGAAWADHRIYRRARAAIARLGLDVEAHVELAQAAARTQREVAAMQAAGQTRRAA